MNEISMKESFSCAMRPYDGQLKKEKKESIDWGRGWYFLGLCTRFIVSPGRAFGRSAKTGYQFGFVPSRGPLFRRTFKTEEEKGQELAWI